MKQKYLIRLSICTLVLIFILHLMCEWHIGIIWTMRLDMLDRVLKEKLSQAIQTQVNRLPYPDGTIVNLFSVPIDSLYQFKEMEKFRFEGAQQTSAVLQNWYGMPEISLDTLKAEMEQELPYYFLGDNPLDLHKLSPDAINRIEGTKFIGIKLERSYSGSNDCSRVRLSVPAYLNGSQGTVVVGELGAGSWENYFYSYFCTVVVIVSLYFILRKLKRQQARVERKRKDFYLQAEKMREPVYQISSDISSNKWSLICNAVQQLLNNVAKTLTCAKQENTENTGLAKLRIPWLFLISGIALSVMLLLTIHWSILIYQEEKRDMLFRLRVSLERAMLQEDEYRYYQTFDVKNAHDFCHLAAMTDSCRAHLSVWQEELCISRDTVNGSNVILRADRKARWQRIDRNGNNAPIDTARLVSFFNTELHRSNLPAGSLYFGERYSDTLSSYGENEYVTRPHQLYQKRPGWVQGSINVNFFNVIASAWFTFLCLLLILVFTLLCICFLWLAVCRQRRLEQFMRDFTYSMIHDMKSPLQSLLMGAQILASGRLADKLERARGILRAMTDECRHLLTLSNRVVTLTQMERGELELHKASVALRPLLDDLSGKFRLKAPKPVAFEVDCPADFQVTADEFCLREVLSNLIDNALKYSRESVSIRLSAESGADGSVLIRVRDNGIGIPAREQQRIFGKFERVASGSRATGASGFGLGLNFVWQVVRAHGGRVEVRSDGKSFSEFGVWLPA